MRSNTPDEALRSLARRQHRQVTHAQLRALGFSLEAIRHRLRKRLLHRVFSCVYSVGTPPNTPLERAAAAVLACGDGAALSHGSALTLWGVNKRWDEALHVTAQADRRPSGIVVHQSQTLTRADIRTHYGIKVTTLARGLLDAAPTLPTRRLTRAVNDALLSPYMTGSQLADVVQRNPSHRGAKALRRFVAAGAGGPTRSDLEDLFLAFCARFDLPKPLINTIVCGHEADALFEAEGVIVELDSWDFHRQRGAFESDRDRDAERLAHDLVSVRVTWHRLTYRAELEAARLQRILATRASRRRPRSATPTAHPRSTGTRDVPAARRRARGRRAR